MLSNLKKCDIPEKLIDRKMQKVTGCHAISNAFNNFSNNYFNNFTNSELNEVDISIEIAKDASNASSDGFGPDFIPVQV